MNIDKILQSIRENEGFRLRTYLDSLDFPTIGYGFRIKDLIMPKSAAEIILRHKVFEIIKKIEKRFDWFEVMPDPVQEVIIEMCYQLGLEGFAGFKKTIQYFKKRDWLKAADEMLDSEWAKQTPARANQLSQRVWKLWGKKNDIGDQL